MGFGKRSVPMMEEDGESDHPPLLRLIFLYLDQPIGRYARYIILGRGSVLCLCSYSRTNSILLALTTDLLSNIISSLEYTPHILSAFFAFDARLTFKTNQFTAPFVRFSTPEQ